MEWSGFLRFSVFATVGISRDIYPGVVCVCMHVYARVHACLHACLLRAVKALVLTVCCQVHTTEKPRILEPQKCPNEVERVCLGTCGMPAPHPILSTVLSSVFGFPTFTLTPSDFWTIFKQNVCSHPVLCMKHFTLQVCRG